MMDRSGFLRTLSLTQNEHIPAPSPFSMMNIGSGEGEGQSLFSHGLQVDLTCERRLQATRRTNGKRRLATHQILPHSPSHWG